MRQNDNCYDSAFAEGETTIRNIYNWRVKETDRLSAMATELRKVGAMGLRRSRLLNCDTA